MGGIPTLPWPTTLALTIGQQMIANRQEARDRRAAADHQIARIRAVQDAEARRRDAQLRQAQAAQRARFGARGVDSHGGSAAALLDGLADETAREDAETRSLALARIGEIEDRLRRERPPSLIETALDAGGLGFGRFRRNLRRRSLLWP